MKNKQNFRDLWINIKWSNTGEIQLLEIKKKKKEGKKNKKTVAKW